MESGARGVNVVERLDDDALATRASEDFEAFAELYRRYLCPVYRFIRSQTSDDDTAHDLTAHVFFRALSAAKTFRAEGSYKSWIFQIAQNSVSSWGKRNTRSTLVLDHMPDAEDPAPSPATQAITTEARDLVRAKVAELPPAQREVVSLRYLEDLSISETANVTHRSPGAVRILLHRARLRLRVALQEKA